MGIYLGENGNNGNAISISKYMSVHTLIYGSVVANRGADLTRSQAISAGISDLDTLDMRHEKLIPLKIRRCSARICHGGELIEKRNILRFSKASTIARSLRS